MKKNKIFIIFTIVLSSLVLALSLTDFAAMHDIHNDYISAKMVEHFSISQVLPEWTNTTGEWQIVTISLFTRILFLVFNIEVFRSFCVSILKAPLLHPGHLGAANSAGEAGPVALEIAFYIMLVYRALIHGRTVKVHGWMNAGVIHQRENHIGAELGFGGAGVGRVGQFVGRFPDHTGEFIAIGGMYPARAADHHRFELF